MPIIKQLARVWLSLVFLALIPGVGQAAEPLAEKRPSSQELNKRREELKKLSPEEREAKLKEWRETNAGPARQEWEKRREEFNKLPPAEREAKRLEIRSRLEKRIAELRVRQTNSTLSTEDAKRLERSEQLLKRFEQNGPGLSGAERPAKREDAAPRPPEK